MNLGLNLLSLVKKNVIKFLQKLRKKNFIFLNFFLYKKDLLNNF